jgi:signal transduction histidine kinase
VAAVVFAVLVLGIILVFGHLLSRSMSQRYLQDALISGREQAQTVAAALDDGAAQELEVRERRREELVRTLVGLPQRRILESIEVTDRDGEVVFESSFSSTEAVPEELASHLELKGGISDGDVLETQTSYRITVPVGEVGEVVVNVSKVRLAERVARIQEELLHQTLLVAGITLLTLVAAFSFVWHLIQRTRRLEEQRREAAEMASLGVLAANLAHEIRNPLNSINLNLELLEEDLAGDNADAVDSLTSTRQEVGRLARLVSDFLTYARPVEPSVSTVQVEDLLREVAEFLRGEARRQGAHIRLRSELDDVEVRGDAGQLRQVLLNLVLNAVQAVAGLDPERRLVELAAEVSDGAVRIGVRDRGPGIPEPELERVRRPFVSLRRGGTGLGLAIAERIVHSHGGRLELSNLEPGLEAAVVLPVAPRNGKMSEASGAVGRVTMPSGRRSD